MNKGLHNVKTEYCIFLNSGDEFCKDDVLFFVLNQAKGALWGYGAIRHIYSNGDRKKYNFFPYVQSLHKYGFRYVPHPATFFHTNTIKSLKGFNENYKVAADQELILRLSLIQRPKVIWRELVEFNREGISSTRGFTEIKRDFYDIRTEIFNRNVLDARIFNFFWKLLGWWYDSRKD
jgi:hypothetical protein